MVYITWLLSFENDFAVKCYIWKWNYISHVVVLTLIAAVYSSWISYWGRTEIGRYFNAIQIYYRIDKDSLFTKKKYLMIVFSNPHSRNASDAPHRIVSISQIVAYRQLRKYCPTGVVAHEVCMCVWVCLFVCFTIGLYTPKTMDPLKRWMSWQGNVFFLSFCS